MMDIYTALAGVLHGERTKRGLTQKEVGSKNVVGDHERCYKRMSLKNAAAYAEALGLRLSEFIALAEAYQRGEYL